MLRLLPAMRDPGLDLLSDAAYHERLVATTLTEGRVPALDRMSDAPEGRDPGRYLPPGLYVVGAAFHRLLGSSGHADLRFHLMLLTALAGALAAWPVAIITRVLFGPSRGAVVAALVVATLPAHLHRSFGYWVRYDALGTLLILGHLAFAVWALDPARARRRLWAVLSALMMLGAVWVWRVALLLPVLEALFVAGWVAWRGSTPRLREWFLILIAGGLAAFPTIEYLRVQRLARSGVWLAAAAMAVALFLPALSPGRRWWIRGLIVAAVAVVGAGAGAWLGVPGHYHTVVDLVRAKLLLAMSGEAAVPPRTMLMLGVEELHGLTPLGLLVGPQVLAAVGPWLLAAPFLLRRRTAAGTDAHAEPNVAFALIGFLTVAYGVLSLFFLRNEIILGPLVAVWCGGLWCAFSDTRRAMRGRRIVFGLFAGSLLATATCGVLLAASRESRMERGLRAVLTEVRDSTPSDATVLSIWDLGYEIQSYGGRATVTDGLLESAANQQAILDSYAAFLDPDPAPLTGVLDHHRADYLLVPPAGALIHIADVLRAPVVERLERGEPLTAADSALAIVRLMHGQPIPGLELHARIGRYRIYRRVADTTAN